MESTHRQINGHMNIPVFVCKVISINADTRLCEITIKNVLASYIQYGFLVEAAMVDITASCARTN